MVADPTVVGAVPRVGLRLIGFRSGVGIGAMDSNRN